MFLSKRCVEPASDEVMRQGPNTTVTCRGNGVASVLCYTVTQCLCWTLFTRVVRGLFYVKSVTTYSLSHFYIS